MSHAEVRIAEIRAHIQRERDSIESSALRHRVTGEYHNQRKQGAVIALDEVLAFIDREPT